MKYLIRLFLSLMLLSLWTGCTHEELSICDGENTLVLRVETGKAPNARATEPGQDIYNENKVGSISVLFYLEGQLRWQVKSTDYQIHEGAYIIPVKEQMRPLFNGNNNFSIYVVANLDFNALATEAALSQFVVEKSIEVSSTTAPADFVMLAHGNKQINMATTEGKLLGDYKLKRVAAKIRMIKPTINVQGYEVVGNIQAKFRNSVTKGFLTTEAQEIPAAASYKTSEYLDIAESAPANSIHFYSYYNKWTLSTPEKRPEFFIMVKFKKTGQPDNTAKPYYYRVPLESQDNQVKSNVLYNLNVKIEILGSLQEPEAVSVNGTLAIEEWILHQDAFNLPATNYLIVEQHEIFMNNVNTYSVKYQTSQKPISISIQSVTFSYVSSDGTQHNDLVASSSDQYPTITSDNTSIIITSKIPVNNVPKKIVFEVTNGVAGLKETVTVLQYPAQFIVNTLGTASAWRPDGSLAPGLNNKAIYHVVVLVPPENLFEDGTQTIIGYPPTETISFHKKENNTYPIVWSDTNATKQDLETSRMISPSFELASQLGATLPMPYLEYWPGTSYLLDYSGNYNNKRYALFNCAFYWEKRKVNNEEIKFDDWRLPTEAEIKLIDKLQHNEQSAVQAIMTGNYYWDSYSANGSYKMQGGGGQGNSSKAYVRCVRDVKKPIRDKKSGK